MKKETIQERPHPEVAGSGNGSAGKDHPLASSAGVFADDPLWDEFIQAMEEARCEIDAAHPVSE
ncbi:MAG: hypothetical protein JO250_11855 [Armatimonadetes bacterium]|nr:hypothetical protein [Armatimonadota bacterium]